MTEQLNGADELFTAYIQVCPFRDPETGMFPFTYWLNASYDYSDTILESRINAVEVPPNAIVLQCLHQISVALTGVTAITVGDGDDPNGWIANAYGAGTAGVSRTDYTAAYAAVSKYYPDGDIIEVIFDAAPSAGSGKLFVKVLSYFEDLTDT